MVKEYIRFTPELTPPDMETVQAVVDRNFFTVQTVLDSVQDGHLDVVYEEPDKPNQGDIRYADGTSWNPGSGEGIYFYNSAGNWVKL